VELSMPPTVPPAVEGMIEAKPPIWLVKAPSE
jgi:hypothetical protein